MRFTIEKICSDKILKRGVLTPVEAWQVIDNGFAPLYKKSKALPINLSKRAATIICVELNTEWQEFLANPW